ncbi:MAG TPA: hemolysin family protein [Anaerolineaceae bacterium]|nr:hemolysin family protein [Anaerolineaceae bacterium]
MIVRNIVLIFILIALNGFFVAVEFAAVTARRARLDLLVGYEDRGRAAQIVHGWLENTATRDRLIAASQLGITVVSLALGAVGENTFAELLDPYFHAVELPGWMQFLAQFLPALPLILSLIIVTSFHVVLGEQVPKVAVLRAPEKFALFAAPIMQAFGNVFRGFISILDFATRGVLTLVGLPRASPHSSVYSLEEIRQIVSGPEVDGVIELPERQMLTAIIDFGELVVRQVVIPRTEIVAVEAGTPLEEVIDLASQSTVTKFPVYEDNLDQIVGILHVRDLLKAIKDPEVTGRKARDLAREPIFVPETIAVNDLLQVFRARRQHIAIVLDEYGGTNGLVTLEDLMEEIIGEVRDPFEAGPPSIQTLPDGSALVDGMTLIDEINEFFGLHLIDPNYDTIAGYMLGKLGRIPQTGETFEDVKEGIRLRVESMDNLRIARLALQKLT